MKEKLIKILYVEDDEDIAQVVAIALEDLCGFEVKCCSSGVEALKELPKFLPQLVLMDMMMPSMDGLETFSHMKKMDNIRDIPVIFLTAKMQSEEQKSYFDAGAIGVISKPFDPEKLCTNIDELWNQHKQ